MKSLLIVLTMALGMAVVASATEIENSNSGDGGCDTGKICYPKSVVEKWNKSIQEKKNRPVPTPSPVVIERVVEKNVTKKNNLSVIGIRAYTGLETNSTGPLSVDAKTTPQYGVGLMYQRDIFDQLRLSIGVTTKGPMAGAGFNF